MHQSARASRGSPNASTLLLALTAATLLAGLSGCIPAEKRKQMADADSLLAGVFKETSPAEAAAWAADPYDADKRARGTQLLANAPFGGAEPYLNLYRERVNDESAPVRSIGARALALHGTPDDVPRILPLLKADEMLVRLDAARALQRLHNPVAVAPLIERMDIDKEPEAEIRAEAASALGQYAEGRVLQALITGLADPSLLVNANSQLSLRTLTGNDALPPERKPWVDWVKANERPFAARRAYVYPVFWREKRWLDYVPFMPAVPNEQASTPAGFSLDEPSTSPGAPKATSEKRSG